MISSGFIITNYHAHNYGTSIIIHIITTIYKFITYIWVNYHISLTWILRPFGDDFPKKTMDSRVENREPLWNHYGTTAPHHRITAAIESQTWNSSSVRVFWMNSKCSDMNFPMHPAAQTFEKKIGDLTYINICMYIYICIYICIYVYMYICIYVYVYMEICMNVYMYLCIYVSMCRLCRLCRFWRLCSMHRYMSCMLYMLRVLYIYIYCSKIMPSWRKSWKRQPFINQMVVSNLTFSIKNCHFQRHPYGCMGWSGSSFSLSNRLFKGAIP